MRKFLFFISVFTLLTAFCLSAQGTEAANEYVLFGRYEQTDESQPIEWIVLDRQEDRMLLLSRYALDCQPYHAVEDWNATWETCGLRRWLNGEFLLSAFDESERQRILTVVNSNPGISVSNTLTSDGGNDTSDQVFLLSLDEVMTYLPNEESRIATATEAAVRRGARVSRSTGTTYWWLRTPAATQDAVLIVRYDGTVPDCGDSMEATVYAVRPALWVSVEE